jgi:parallel beta-helix repeat protein
MNGTKSTRPEARRGCDPRRTPRRKLARRGIAAILAVTAALLAVTVDPASADTLACGQVITANTTLQNDLVGCSEDGIVIGADRITLDLNGHTVSAAACEVDCVEQIGIANTAGHHGVRIVNGTISGFTTNVSLVGATDNTLANLTVGGFPVFADFVGVSLSDSHGNRLDRITASGGNPAVRLTSSDRNAILRSSINGGVSIRVGRSLALVDGSDNNLLADSDLTGEEGTAIFDSAANLLVRNIIDGGSDAIGLAGARGNVIANNTLTSSGFGAIPIEMFSASDANVIRGNRMPRGGMRILGDANRIARNNVVGRFAILDQSAIEIIGGRANLVVFNRARAGADNVAVRSDASATMIVGNIVSGALDDGIDVDAPGTVVRANVANDNGDLGIEAIEGTIDGRGNRASGNGNPLQCVNVVCR